MDRITPEQRSKLISRIDDEAIMSGLQARLLSRLEKGDTCGPFAAAIVDCNGVILAEAVNSVVDSRRSHCHAEMNAIALLEDKLGTWDLSGKGLTLFASAEPCMMCIGGILWSGIERVVYGVSTETVERIAGFDEGFKPSWREEFAKRGIDVKGPICEEVGAKAFYEYVKRKGIVYQRRQAAGA